MLQMILPCSLSSYQTLILKNIPPHSSHLYPPPPQLDRSPTIISTMYISTFINPLTVIYLLLTIFSFFFSPIPSIVALLTFITLILVYHVARIALPAHPSKLRSYSTLIAFAGPPLQAIALAGLFVILAIPFVLVKGKYVLTNAASDYDPIRILTAVRDALTDPHMPTLSAFSWVYVIFIIAIVMFIPSATLLIIGYPSKYLVDDHFFWNSSNTLLLGQSAITGLMVGYEMYRLLITILVYAYYGDALRSQLRVKPPIFLQILIIIPGVLFELSGQLYVSVGIAKHQFYNIGEKYSAVAVVWAVKALSSFLIVIFAIAMVQGFWSVVWMVAMFLTTFLGCWFWWCWVQMRRLQRLEACSAGEREGLMAP